MFQNCFKLYSETLVSDMCHLLVSRSCWLSDLLELLVVRRVVPGQDVYTPNSRHLFNTNMYLIHVYGKINIKMHFSNSLVLKFLLIIHYASLCDEIKCVGISKDFSIECNSQIFRNKKFRYVNFIFNDILNIF